MHVMRTDKKNGITTEAYRAGSLRKPKTDVDEFMSAPDSDQAMHGFHGTRGRTMPGVYEGTPLTGRPSSPPRRLAPVAQLVTAWAHRCVGHGSSWPVQNPTPTRGIATPQLSIDSRAVDMDTVFLNSSRMRHERTVSPVLSTQAGPSVPCVGAAAVAVVVSRGLGHQCNDPRFREWHARRRPAEVRCQTATA